jgi:enamine deaminase RidA (YjgF/YER057c/UK114 family)
MTCYVTSVEDYLRSAKQIGAAWREIIGTHYPTMALVEVRRLVERQALIEIEATAVVEE